MCGIAGVHYLDAADTGRLDTGRLAAALLRGIDSRGGDATGFAALKPDGSVVCQKAAVRAPEFLRHWRGIPAGAQTVLLHTRWATQGDAGWPENNHPVRSGSVWVVHNGAITNDGAVFARTPKVRHGQVDSEAIPAVIREAGWENAGAGLETLDGGFAIGAMDESRPGELLLAKGDWSPLVYFASDRLVVWASTEAALRDAWRDAIGTPPSWKKIKTMLAGDILRVVDGSVVLDEFVPYQRPIQTTSTPAWKDRPTWTTHWPVSTVDTRADVRRYGLDMGQQGFSCRPAGLLDAAEVDDAAAVIRCACCHDWTEVADMSDIYGESVCRDCYVVLADEMNRGRPVVMA